MKEVLIGTIVNTHGLKGELKIVSDFNYKDYVFTKGFTLYVGKNRKPFKIISYRHHKIYDMVVLEGIDNIDLALSYKGDDVYINRCDLQIDGYINEDIIGFDVVVNDKKIGKVTSIINNGAHDIIVFNDSYDCKQMIPFVNEYVKDVNLTKKVVNIEVVEGLLNEN